MPQGPAALAAAGLGRGRRRPEPAPAQLQGGEPSGVAAAAGELVRAPPPVHAAGEARLPDLRPALSLPSCRERVSASFVGPAGRRTHAPVTRHVTSLPYHDRS